MSPSTVCSRPPRLTSRLIGAMNAAIRSWKATSPPRERLPFDHPQAAEPQDQRRVDRREQRRHGVEDLGVPLQLLLAVDHLGLVARPAGEEVGLAARRLQRLDRLQAADRRAEELAPVLDQPAVAVHPPAGDEAQGDDVERHHGDPHQGQHGVVLEQDEGEEDRPSRRPGRWSPGRARAAAPRGR